MAIKLQFQAAPLQNGFEVLVCWIIKKEAVISMSPMSNWLFVAAWIFQAVFCWKKNRERGQNYIQSNEFWIKKREPQIFKINLWRFSKTSWFNWRLIVTKEGTNILQILQIQVKVDSKKKVAQADEALQSCQFVLFIQTMNNIFVSLTKSSKPWWPFS